MNEEKEVMVEETEIEIETEREAVDGEKIILQQEETEQVKISPAQGEQKDWRDSVYGNIKMSVRTLDIVIGIMLGFIVLVLLTGAIKNFL